MRRCWRTRLGPADSGDSDERHLDTELSRGPAPDGRDGRGQQVQHQPGVHRASEQTLRQLCERRFDGKDILIVYIDGIQFGQTHVIVALGVDSQGYKHVLGLREGASENATVVKDLLTDIVARGLEAGRRRLFVIDGSKALRKAIDEVFGSKNPIQRCRNHKIRNVLDYLPKDRQADVRRR